MLTVNPGGVIRLCSAALIGTTACATKKLSSRSFDFHLNSLPHVNNINGSVRRLCGRDNPIKLGKQTLMDGNECERYQIEWPLILMIAFIFRRITKPGQHQYLSAQMSARMYIYQRMDD